MVAALRSNSKANKLGDPLEMPGGGWANRGTTNLREAQNLTPDKAPVIACMFLCAIGYSMRDRVRNLDRDLKTNALFGISFFIILKTAVDVIRGLLDPKKRKRQPQMYHNFADQRCWCCNIPNSNDVLSNLPFLLGLVPAIQMLSTGALGDFHDPRESAAWIVCYLGTSGEL